MYKTLLRRESRDISWIFWMFDFCWIYSYLYILSGVELHWIVLSKDMHWICFATQSDRVRPVCLLQLDVFRAAFSHIGLSHLGLCTFLSRFIGFGLWLIGPSFLGQIRTGSRGIADEHTPDSPAGGALATPLDINLTYLRDRIWGWVGLAMPPTYPRLN